MWKDLTVKHKLTRSFLNHNIIEQMDIKDEKEKFP